MTPQNFIASRVLDLFANLRQLTESRKHLLDERGMVVIDLDEALFEGESPPVVKLFD